ncbi:MAG: GNAT family N-acetyltransferase [Gammaproteobacteria bacterium]|nr:GNAT family N-acetyltransferase [Gammaproteobacteria bacterium]
MIETPSLRLVPATSDVLRQVRSAGLEGLAELLGITIPPAWPVFPEGLENAVTQLDVIPPHPPFCMWLGILKENDSLVAEGGLFQAADGVIEFGYAIVPDYRGRGLAREYATALVDLARHHPGTRRVQAHSLAPGSRSGDGLEADPSVNLLESLGFEGAPVKDAPGAAPGEAVWRWQLEVA